MDVEKQKPVERLFPFAKRARIVIPGGENLVRSKRRLHFVLLSTDLSDSSKQQVLSEFSHYPVVQRYTSAQLTEYFGIKGAKVIGFAKSDLARSLYAELKSCRVNQPLHANTSKSEKSVNPEVR